MIGWVQLPCPFYRGGFHSQISTRKLPYRQAGRLAGLVFEFHLKLETRGGNRKQSSNCVCADQLDSQSNKILQDISIIILKKKKKRYKKKVNVACTEGCLEINDSVNLGRCPLVVGSHTGV